MAEANTSQPAASTPPLSVSERIAGMFEKDVPQPGEGETPPEGEEQNLETGEPVVEGAEAKADGETPAPAQPEEVEVDIEGEKYLIPKKIADRFIQHADYTKKTMDLAELRRATNAERAAFAQEQAFQQDVSTEMRQMALLDAQIDAYKRVDWAGMEAAQLMTARAQLDQLKDTRADLDRAVQAKRKGFEQKVAQALNESLQAGNTYIAQRINGYNDTVKQGILRHAVADGYTPDELNMVRDPRLVVTLWKASQWDALQASKPAVNKRTAQSAPVVKPGASNNQTTTTADAKYKKDLASAKTPQQRSRVIQARLAQKVMRTGGGQR